MYECDYFSYLSLKPPRQQSISAHHRLNGLYAPTGKVKKRDYILLTLKPCRAILDDSWEADVSINYFLHDVISALFAVCSFNFSM